LLSRWGAWHNGKAKVASQGESDVTTTVHLTEEELAELKELTKLDDPAKAVRAAMQDYLRYARRLQLKHLSGRVHMQDNWQELEAAELESQRDTDGIGTD
jgi:hypothetical protein